MQKGSSKGGKADRICSMTGQSVSALIRIATCKVTVGIVPRKGVVVGVMVGEAILNPPRSSS